MIKGTNLTLSITRKDDVRTILNDVSFTVPKGRVTAFIGPSGAGKTSVLRCCAALTTSFQGSLSLDGKALSALSDRERVHTVGFVFQQFNLFPHMTVLENCMAPLRYEGQPEEVAQARAHEVLGMVGMASFAQRYPHHLSGGQQQRVAIARALALHPSTLLLDEPTSGLDPDSTKMLIDVISSLTRAGITIAFASHDMSFIHATLDRVYFMENGAIVESYDSQEEELAGQERICSFLSCR